MIVACLKWSARPGDATTTDDGAPTDERFAGVSEADQAALEVALDLVGRLGPVAGDGVTAIAVGPDGADRVLRDALACGAGRAIRVDAPAGISSADVGAAIASVVPAAAVVVCGDYSMDRGSGSVPAFVAHHLDAAQALGLISVQASPDSADRLTAMRRLDGGRRELLEVPVPCVVSVEGSTANLRRAGLRAALASRSAPIEVVPCPVPVHHVATPIVAPFRPRARVMPPPAGDAALDRVRALTDLGAAPVRGEVITAADPADAARRIVRSLRDWGYLD